MQEASLEVLRAILAAQPRPIEDSTGAKLLSEIDRVMHGAQFSVAELILESEDSDLPALSAAIIETCHIVSARHVASWFREHEGEELGTFRIRRVSKRTADGIRWQVVQK